MNGPLLEVDGLTVLLDVEGARRAVLSDISFAIRPGEAVGLVRCLHALGGHGHAAGVGQGYQAGDHRFGEGGGVGVVEVGDEGGVYLQGGGWEVAEWPLAAGSCSGS